MGQGTIWKQLASILVLASCSLLSSCASSPTVSAACGQHKDYKQKLQACTSEVAANPVNSLARFHLAVAQYNLGRNQDALQNIDVAIDAGPKEGWYYFERCNIRYALNQLPGALQDCSTAINIVGKGQAYQIYGTRGVIDYWLGKYADAKSDLDTAIELNPDYAISYIMECKTFFTTGDFQGAVNLCGKFLEKTSNQDDQAYFWAMAYSGAAYYRLNQYDRARPFADWLLQHNPRNALEFSGDHELDLFNLDARRGKIKTLLAEAKLDESLGDISKEFSLYEEASAYSMGYTPADEKQNYDIIDELQALYPKLVVKPPLPENANQYQVEGATYFKNNDYSGALKAYNLAEGIAPWYPPLAYNLALLSAQQKDYVRAIQFMNLYIKLAPNAPDIKESQNQVYEWTAEANSVN